MFQLSASGNAIEETEGVETVGGESLGVSFLEEPATTVRLLSEGGPLPANETASDSAFFEAKSNFDPQSTHVLLDWTERLEMASSLTDPVLETATIL
ncbi:hypothetical protein [Natronobacterium lacisalsi]|uniref:hypothetical protein n=1 Tax=Natronobacterium lacisalsi TaxID=229731 RepID=UPI001268E8AB|nr:hypothetical protein [Halobiforma lacisalsi]